MADRLVVNGTAAEIGLTDTLAELDTDGTQGANAALIFTAVPPGVRGNFIKVAQTVPADDNAAHPIDVSVAVDGEFKVITIQLEVDTDGSTILSTGDDIKAAVAADPEASALVTVADKAANDGSGLASTFAAAALTGGLLDDVEPFSMRVIDLAEANLTTLLDGGAAILPDNLSYEARRAIARTIKYERVRDNEGLLQ